MGQVFCAKDGYIYIVMQFFKVFSNHGDRSDSIDYQVRVYRNVIPYPGAGVHLLRCGHIYCDLFKKNTYWINIFFFTLRRTSEKLVYIDIDVGKVKIEGFFFIWHDCIMRHLGKMLYFIRNRVLFFWSQYQLTGL